MITVNLYHTQTHIAVPSQHFLSLGMWWIQISHKDESRISSQNLPLVFSLPLNYSADIQSAGFWLSKEDEAAEIMSGENGMQFLPGIFWPE